MLALLVSSTHDLSLRAKETAMEVSKESAFLFYTHISIQLIQRQKLSTFVSYQLQQRCCDQGQKIRKGQDTAFPLAPSLLPAFVSRFIITVLPYGLQEVSLRIPYLASHSPTLLSFLFFLFYFLRSKNNLLVLQQNFRYELFSSQPVLCFVVPFLESG
jgi:hypothetical protein